jgi:hypothetical protein
MGQVLLRLLLVFGGIAAVLILVQRLMWTNAILFYVLAGGLPFLILFVIFAASQRPRRRL